MSSPVSVRYRLFVEIDIDMDGDPVDLTQLDGVAAEIMAGLEGSDAYPDINDRLRDNGENDEYADCVRADCVHFVCSGAEEVR